MLEDIDQLIRMAQVMKIRASNLSAELDRKPKVQKAFVRAALAASEHAIEIQSQLERIRNHLI